MVRGKFKLDQITANAGQSGKQLTFKAVCNDGTPENERFHRYTPSGSLSMYVDSEPALAQFELGKEYYLDFTPVPAS